MTSVQTASAPALMYTYAHELAAPAGRLGRSIETFTGARVATRDLTKQVLAAAVLEVLDRGAGQIVDEQRKVLFRTKQVKVLRTNGSIPEPTLPGAISRMAVNGIVLEDLVETLAGGEQNDPDYWVLERVREELHARGIAQKAEVGRGKAILKGMFSSTTYTIDPNAATGLRGAFEQFAQGWRGRQGPAVADLIERMDKSLTRATRQVDHNHGSSD